MGAEGAPGRRLSWMGVTVAVGVLGVLLVTVAVSPARPGFHFARLAGADRYGTAAGIAASSFTSSDSVILATGERFPDALAANYVAGVADVPILLTAANSVPAATAQAIQNLHVTKVVIAGGPAAVSAAVASALAAQGLTVGRLAGQDRYDTARLAAQSAGPSSVGTIGGKPTAIVASGENYPDALAAGPLSYALHFPTILTPGASLAAAAQSALQSLGIKQVLLAGGTNAVSAATAQQIAALGITVQRFAGADRTQTAALLAEFAVTNLGFENSHVNLARGDDFADALAGGTQGGKETAVVLLTSSPTDLGTATGNWLQSHALTLADGHIFGGTNAVSAATEAQATAAATLPGTSSSSSSTSTTSGSSTTTSVTLPTSTTVTLPTTTVTLPTTTTVTLPTTTTVTLPTSTSITLPVTTTTICILPPICI